MSKIPGIEIGVDILDYDKLKRRLRAIRDGVDIILKGFDEADGNETQTDDSPEQSASMGKCPQCKGTGSVYVFQHGLKTCVFCNGFGRVPWGSVDRETA